MIPLWKGASNATPKGHINAGLAAIRANPPTVDPSLSLAALHPGLVEEWDVELNGELSPSQVSPGSLRKVWWRCKAGPDHAWPATVGNRVRGSRCPCCANRRISVTNSLATLHPEIAAQWDEAANGGLTADMVLAGSKTVYGWQCSVDPTHRWSVSVNYRTVDHSGCPHCLNEAKAEKTLARLYPELAAQWHPTANGDLTAEDVTFGLTKKVWWRCPDVEGHEWLAAISNRTGRKSGCPHCGRETKSAKLAARMASGRAFHSSLEKAAAPLLTPLGYRPHAIAVEGHRFDLGNPELNAVVEVNGCYWHDHRALKPGCPVRVRAKLPAHGRTYLETDERVRALAANHGLALLELWGCEQAEWPAQIATFVASLPAPASS